MRYGVKNQRGDQLLAFAGHPLSLAAALAIAFAIGCTQAATQTTGSAAALTKSQTPATTEVAQTRPTTAANESAAAPTDPAAADESSAPANGAQPREAAKPVVSEYAPGVPPVQLSSAHSDLCKVGVGEVLPTIELPKLGGGNATLESLAGAKATVVLFWTADRWMSETALRDLARLAAGDDVHLVGIVEGAADAAQKLIDKSGAKFTQLVDAEGVALAQVGKDALPRIYVLDGQRRIAWFDIEFSESTHRELRQTLAVLTGARAK